MRGGGGRRGGEILGVDWFLFGPRCEAGEGGAGGGSEGEGVGGEVLEIHWFLLASNVRKS